MRTWLSTITRRPRGISPTVPCALELRIRAGGTTISTRPVATSYTRLPIVCKFLRKELQCYESAKPSILGLVYHPHAARAQFFEDAIMRDGGTDHGNDLETMQQRRTANERISDTSGERQQPLSASPSEWRLSWCLRSCLLVVQACCCSRHTHLWSLALIGNASAEKFPQRRA